MARPRRSPEAANAHDLDAFVGRFADDYDSRQPAHPDRAFRTIFAVRAGRIAEAPPYLEPIEREGWRDRRRGARHLRSSVSTLTVT